MTLSSELIAAIETVLNRRESEFNADVAESIGVRPTELSTFASVLKAIDEISKPKPELFTGVPKAELEAFLRWKEAVRAARI